MESIVRATANNTIKIGQKVNELELQIDSLKKEVAKLLVNQQIMNENLLRILDKLAETK